MQIDPTDKRITELCEKLATAKGEEVEQLAADLRRALHDHVQFMRLMTRKAARRFPKNDSDSKAAD